MTDSLHVNPEKLSAADRKLAVQSTPGVAGGAKWFWWIAGLSIVNTVMIHSGSNTSFLIGLGFTLVADTIFQSVRAIAFAIDAVAIGFFFAMGLLALRGYFWAFAVGAAVYVCDALIYLKFEDFMPVAFHGLALFYIGKAGLALRNALQEAKFAAANPTTPAAPAPQPPELPKI